LKKQLDKSREETAEERQSSFEDLVLGVETIQRRSEGLLKFAQTYRNLNKITTLNLRKVYVRDLFENLNQLMQPTLEQKGIELEIILKDPELMVSGGPQPCRASVDQLACKCHGSRQGPARATNYSFRGHVANIE
jgi:signal transduction histidine kinase